MTELIATAGLLGVGKTTLVERLAPRLDAVPCRETVAAEDFLRQFYEDPATHALQTETVYLLARYTALKKALAPSPTRILSDFVPFKGLVYGSVTLQGAEREAFRAIYGAVAPLMPQPSLVLDVRAGLETVLARIKARRRPGEPQLVTRDYLQRLRAAYDRELARSGLPLLEVDAERWDFRVDGDLDALAGKVEERLVAVQRRRQAGGPAPGSMAASPCDGGTASP